MSKNSAERIEAEDGRQYHIGLAPGDVAPHVILCGDPERVDRAATLFLEPGYKTWSHREYRTHSGKTPKGLELTIMATGMGCDNTEIAVIELLNCRRDITLIRVGSCGALQDGMNIGDLVISTGAVRLENTSAGFVEPGYPAVAHHEIVSSLLSSAKSLGHPHHCGITATASGFYGWQGRRKQAIPPRDPELLDRLRDQKVVNLEMEASTLFVLATLAGVRAGAVCAVFANRVHDRFISAEEKPAAEERALRCALAAF